MKDDLVSLAKELKEENEKLKKDKLTWLYNRHVFEKAFEDLIKSWEVFSFAILDIDKFKSINDSYSHVVWDKVLKYFADFLLEFFLPEEVFRFWWEEFVILAKWTDEDVFERINKVLKKLNETKVMYKKSIHIPLTFSWWVSQVEDWEWEDAVYKRADELVYRAKQNWRNQIMIK
jgi:diguanylate cyclase (GGDEF)-like protein